MRIALVLVLALTAGCTIPGGDVEGDAAGERRWDAEIQQPVDIETSYANGSFQRVIALDVELGPAGTVQVFGEVSIHTEYWEETKLWHRLLIDGTPRELGEVADGYGDYREGGVEGGWTRMTASWADSWNEVVDLSAGSHAIEYQVKGRHTNQGDYASGLPPQAVDGSLSVLML